MKIFFLRGSSSQGSKDKQVKENEKPKYNLPRVAEVRPCEWPCDDFLRAAGINDDFYSLVDKTALGDCSLLCDSSNGPIIFCSSALFFANLCCIGDHVLELACQIYMVTSNSNA